MRLRVSPKESATRQLSKKEAAKTRLAIIRAEYNSDITQSLEMQCVQTLEAAGIAAKNISIFAVPGCFEIPITAQRLARQEYYDAMIALGAVIRGDTYHFELVVEGCAQGIMDVSLRHNVPIIFEVLATYSRRDALRRAANNRFNKGIEAAQTALSLLTTLSRIKESRTHVRIRNR